MEEESPLRRKAASGLYADFRGILKPAIDGARDCGATLARGGDVFL